GRRPEGGPNPRAARASPGRSGPLGRRGRASGERARRTGDDPSSPGGASRTPPRGRASPSRSTAEAPRGPALARPARPPPGGPSATPPPPPPRDASSPHPANESAYVPQDGTSNRRARGLLTAARRARPRRGGRVPRASSPRSTRRPSAPPPGASV